jgi:hypothetical protein
MSVMQGRNVKARIMVKNASAIGIPNGRCGIRILQPF